MTEVFVDASAIVAILQREAGHEELARHLEQAASGITSAVAVFEAVLALIRVRGAADSATVQRVVRDFLERSRVHVMPISEEAGYRALEAHARYGKGTGHPARLNLGDCFAYAMARQQGVALLYTGDDFARTDLA